MTIEKLKKKDCFESSPQLGKGHYVLAACRCYTLQCKAMTNTVQILAVAPATCYKTS